MAYRGGPSRFFKRAESAANFGREIGLQYVHAHIRYVEAMAKLGRAEQAFRGLMTICPIGIENDVPSAHRRQSNAYFSSSDAAFRDRHEASREFERLRTGEIGVKGGWRIYSSGPGIYINQLISNVVGLRRHFDDVVVDPVLPAEADGLTLDLPWDGRSVHYTCHCDWGWDGRPHGGGKRTHGRDAARCLEPVSARRSAHLRRGIHGAARSNPKPGRHRALTRSAAPGRPREPTGERHGPHTLTRRATLSEPTPQR